MHRRLSYTGILCGTKCEYRTAYNDANVCRTRSAFGTWAKLGLTHCCRWASITAALRVKLVFALFIFVISVFAVNLLVFKPSSSFDVILILSELPFSFALLYCVFMFNYDEPCWVSKRCSCLESPDSLQLRLFSSIRSFSIFFILSLLSVSFSLSPSM